jgi:hypothetical protein
MIIEHCTTEEQIAVAKSLIEPVELQSALPQNYDWAVIIDGNALVGVLMWPENTQPPEEFSIAPTLMDENNPNQNLYWGGE